MKKRISPKSKTGDRNAMVELSIIYDRDNELDKAYNWYSKAIKAGSDRGKERMKIFK
jgi:TPR repeat protein